MGQRKMKCISLPLGLAVLLACILSSLVACSSSKSRVGSMLSLNTDLKLVFDVGESLNPDAQQQASPVFLRLYELNDPKAFETADFIDLYDGDEAALGKSLIAKQQLERFVPGQGRTEKVVLKPGTRYVGLYAEFLQYQDAHYKVVLPVTENNVVRNKAVLLIHGNSLVVVDR